MKKAYQKPVLYAESYELAEHIAACGIKLDNNTIFDCQVVGGTFEESEHMEGWFMLPKICNAIQTNSTIQEYCYTNGGCSGVTILHTS